MRIKRGQRARSAFRQTILCSRDGANQLKLATIGLNIIDVIDRARKVGLVIPIGAAGNGERSTIVEGDQELALK
jgi:hypothetical protein